MQKCMRIAGIKTSPVSPLLLLSSTKNLLSKTFFFFQDAKNFLHSRTTERRLREQQVTSQESIFGGIWNKRDMGSFSHNVQWLNYEYCTNTIWHAAPKNQKIKEQWFIKTMEYCIKRYFWSLIVHFTRPPMRC